MVRTALFTRTGRRAPLSQSEKPVLTGTGAVPLTNKPHRWHTAVSYVPQEVSMLRVGIIGLGGNCQLALSRNRRA